MSDRNPVISICRSCIIILLASAIFFTDEGTDARFALLSVSWFCAVIGLGATITDAARKKR